jgi:hypothetical protein
MSVASSSMQTIAPGSIGTWSWHVRILAVVLVRRRDSEMTAQRGP